MGFGLLTLAALAAGWGAVRMAPGVDGWLAPVAAAAIAGGVVLCAWGMHAAMVAVPAQRLVRKMRLFRETRDPDLRFGLSGTGFLGPLAGECKALAEALSAARQETRDIALAEAAKAGGQKVWLESILQNLNEGVFVCNHQHQIMLYNKAAVALPDMPERIGLGRYLGDIIDIGPVSHSLTRLELRHEADPDSLNAISAPFFCTTPDGAKVFHGRMALLIGDSGEVTGYLITLVDGSEDEALLAGGDALQHTLETELAPMLAEIRRSAERIGQIGSAAGGEQEMLVRIVADASREAAEMTDAVSLGIRDLMLRHSTLVDVYALDLIKLVQKTLPEGAPRVVMIGTPLWVRVDSMALVEAIEALVLEIGARLSVTEVFVETRPEEPGLVLELSWKGAPVDAEELDAWLELECQGPGEHQRVRNVLERHGTRLEASGPTSSGSSFLRIPLSAPAQRPDAAPSRRHPARPEFYDAELMAAHQGDADLAERKLGELRYVVFDCEMTGLNPDQGDEIVQIAAVPVVRKRILSGEGMDWVINPGRPIPPRSIKFHGLTDADVADKPTVDEVLPQFHAMASDAVLVAHNAAFDLRFVSLKERTAGVSFDNPVLDTMLISRLLDGEKDDHSLDALCERYNIPNAARHTALGDTIATADLLVKMIGRLEAQGLDTFGEVMRRTNMAAELRHRSAVFAHGTGNGA